MTRIPGWAQPGLGEARRRADELIGRRQSGDPSWSDEQAGWWLSVFVPPVRDGITRGEPVHRWGQFPVVEVTAERGRGEYVFKPSSDGWVLIDNPI